MTSSHFIAPQRYELAQYNAAYIIKNYHDEVEAAGVFTAPTTPMQMALLMLQRSADQEHIASIVQVADVRQRSTRGAPREALHTGRLHASHLHAFFFYKMLVYAQ